MQRLNEIAPGVLSATAAYATTTSTVVTAPDGGCLVIDPAVSVADLAALAADLAGAGLAPLPIQRPIPVWVGAQSPPAYRRVGRIADGWFPQMAPGTQLDEARQIVTQAAAEAGRDPASLGMEGRLRWQEDRDKLAAAMRQWQDADATHLSVNTMGAGLRTVDDHLAALGSAAEAAKTISS